MSNLPPPPPGFVIENLPPPPPGFVMVGQQEEGGPRGLMPFMNRAIGSVVQLPSTVMAMGENVVRRGLGLDEIEPPRPATGLMSAAGIRVADSDAVPETNAEYVGDYVGTAAATLPAQLWGTKALAARKAGTVLGGIGRALYEPFRTAPVRATAAELAAAAGAGVGAKMADDASATGEADPLTRMGAEIAGGATAALAPGLAVRWVGAVGRAAENLPAIGFIAREIRDSFEPFTKAGSKAIASRRMQGVVADVDGARAALDSPSIVDLSPAQKTGDRGLMALEQSILSMDATLAEGARRRSIDNVKILREALSDIPGQATTLDAQQAIAGRRSYVRSLLETRLQQAVDAADAKAAKLTPQKARTENARIMAEELSKARTAAKVQENQLWRAIPDETPVTTSMTKRAYQRFVADLAGPQADDMPDVARRFLSGDTNESYGAETSIKEMLALRSKLLDVARQSRAGDAPNLNRARIADDLAAAVLDDLDVLARQGGEVGGLIDTARTYSRAFAEAFKQGPVADVTRRGRDGAVRVEPGEVARRLITSDEGGVTNIDAVRRATQMGADAAAATGSTGPSVAAANDAAKDYLRRRFVDAVMPTGDYNAKAAERFIRSNDEVLSRFPDLRRELTDARQAQAMADRLGKTTQQRVASIGDRKASAAQDFTQRNRSEAFRAVADADDPVAAARQVVRQASTDTTGQGVRGVKASALDIILTRAGGDALDDGTLMLSGRKMFSLLDDARLGPALREVFDADELKRIRQIADEAARIETWMNPGVSVGEALPKAPDTLMSYALTTIAARQGAKLGQGTSGASLKTASAASKRAQGFWNRFTNDGAKEVLLDSVQNPDTMRALLSPPDDVQAVRYLESRFAPVAAGIAAGSAGADRVGQPEIAEPRNEAEWQALPPGTLFYDPTGQIRRR